MNNFNSITLFIFLDYLVSQKYLYLYDYVKILNIYFIVILIKLKSSNDLIFYVINLLIS